jgi:hypothetical protein
MNANLIAANITITNLISRVTTTDALGYQMYSGITKGNAMMLRTKLKMRPIAIIILSK